ncbi:hypothetical protein Vadar_023309 [Vaccinium darrowii]|uniref:Uncharacterized protein n=1 Tax=Vaccinium darrowii TaxID=229202 RepID=A0ACB7XSD8_9ERIC|nr:hypothetical protein Vadar_023309 [Vaccinium darrowii]
MDVDKANECLVGNSYDQNDQEGTNLVGQFGWKFQSRDELLGTLRQFYSIQGYAISIKNSKNDRYLTIGCDRGGCYQNKWKVPTKHRQRKTATRLINCPFEIRCKRQEDGFWLVEEKNNSHNHEPSSDMSGHPSCRRLSQEEITTIEEMTRSGIPPRQILSSLRQSNPKLQAISRTIYNTKVKLRKGNLARRTTIQVLFEELCQVINSEDEQAFNQAWNFVELLYKEKEKVLCYIRNTWLPFKERFVHAWTKNCTHFGNRVSSRAEGAHAKLKQYLQVSTGDLHQVKNKICLAIDNEFNEIKTQLSSERIRVPHKCDNYFFKELITNVSSFALRELLKQYEMVKCGTMRSTCTGHFMASMGLPCAHKMIGWKGKVIPLKKYIHNGGLMEESWLFLKLEKQMGRIQEVGS